MIVRTKSLRGPPSHNRLCWVRFWFLHSAWTCTAPERASGRVLGSETQRWAAQACPSRGGLRWPLSWGLSMCVSWCQRCAWGQAHCCLLEIIKPNSGFKIQPHKLTDGDWRHTFYTFVCVCVCVKLEYYLHLTLLSVCAQTWCSGLFVRLVGWLCWAKVISLPFLSSDWLPPLTCKHLGVRIIRYLGHQESVSVPWPQ